MILAHAYYVLLAFYQTSVHIACISQFLLYFVFALSLHVL
jgi:hypothetical protein